MNVDTLIDRNIIDDNIIPGVDHVIRNLFVINSLVVDCGIGFGWVIIKKKSNKYKKAMKRDELWKDVK